MSIRKVVAGLLITAGIAIMAVPFFWRATGEKQTEQLISEFEQTLEDDYDEETDVEEEQELIDIEDDIAEIDDDFQIVVSGWSVYVESLNLTLRQGIACVWDAEEGLFMPDFDVTIVYEGNIETQEWLYYEQDGMVVTLGNWLNGRLSCEQIEQLWCELIIPEKNKEQKESEE